MGAFFTVGEEKIRPGVYYRYENYEAGNTVGADDGKCACVIRSNWGPIDSTVLLEAEKDITTYFGDGGTDGTLAVPKQQFIGGAKSVRTVRLGSGGEYGTLTLFDEMGVEVITLFNKYVGSRALSITLRPTLEASYNSIDYNTYEELEEQTYEELEEQTYEELEAVTYTDDAVYEILVLEGTTQLEKITFTNPTGDKTYWELVEKASRSEYYTLKTIRHTDSRLAIINQEEVTGGTDPYIDVNSYSVALENLETYRWNVLALDTEDNSIALMTQIYLNRIYEEGKFVMGVVSDKTSVDLEVRLDRAIAFNDYQMIYVGSGFVDSSGTIYDGYLAAARISGMIAGTPSSQSITHATLTGASDICEHLTTNQYENAITSGMLTFSVSASNVPWVEQGINTLTSLADNMDTGWKKIKRTKVRFELMQRINDAVEPLVGKINNDDDGRMTVVQFGNAICNTMVAEGKISTGAYMAVDDTATNIGDSATFMIYADDIDSMEKLYLGFNFRFSPNA